MSEENPPLALPISPVPAPTPLAEPSWEDDETRATGVLRALFTLAAGGLLAYSQWNTPKTPIAQYWSRWVGTSLVFNFIVPLFVVWMFFGQGLTRQEWLKDQRHNAWNFGWNWTHWRRHLRFALGILAVMLPFLIFFSRDPAVRLSYADYFPVTDSPASWTFFLASLVVYMFCWEWFFRGFGLFGIAQGLGPVAAILLQAIGFGLTHSGKPPVEMASSFVGGALLGAWCWREKSFVPAFFTHTGIQCVWAILVKI